MANRASLQRNGPLELRGGLAVVCLAALATILFGNSGEQKRTFACEASAQTTVSASQHAAFVREFSGPDDVANAPPTALDRSLDILFGHKDATPPGQKMSRPYSVTTDSAHRIIVTDPSEGLVHIFDFEKNRHSSLGGPGSQLRTPVGVAVDEDDNIYVTDSVLGLILVFEPNGKFQKYLGRVAGGEPYFASPSGIVIDKETHRIFVCDPPRQMVISLDKDGHILGHFGKPRGGKGPGEFHNPTRLAISGNDVFVLDSGNSRLQVLDLDGHYLREIRIPELSVETGLAIDAQKKIYVGNLTLDSIDVFTYDGKFLYRFGSLGKDPGQFDRPCGIWIDSRDAIYVTDMRNERVEMFQLVGQE